MNRQTKRMMAREQAQKKAAPRPAVKAPGAPTKRERTKMREFIKEVIAELKKVAWPTRPEVVAYSVVVLVSSVVIAAIIFGLDYVFSNAVLELFGVN